MDIYEILCCYFKTIKFFINTLSRVQFFEISIQIIRKERIFVV